MSRILRSIAFALSLAVTSGAALAQMSVGAAVTAGVADSPAVVCTPGARMFVYDDGAWYAATARDATASTQMCLIRFDGYGEEDDKTISTKEALAWSIDGPGRPVTECTPNDRVLALSDSAWNPATVVKGKASNCLVHFDDPDTKDDSMSVKNLRKLP